VRILVVEKVDYLDDFLAAPVSIPTDEVGWSPVIIYKVFEFVQDRPHLDIVPREDGAFDLLRALF
tara:strand:- start:74 stop:268 length:195 start_codon:yes stop_codon:yes gene_type:complete